MPATLNSKTPDALLAAVRVAYDWRRWARPEQLEPAAAYAIWCILAGRGFGKSRTGAETVRKWINQDKVRRVHLVGRTSQDARDTMIYGESGILSVCAGDIGNQPTYNANRRSVFWPNGAQAVVFSGETPDALRGPQCERWWADELAAWKYLEQTWDNLQFGARLGQVRGIITTTPRPVKLLREIIADADTITTHGRTLDNAANLSPNALKALLRKYEGTRIGRQELNAEILDDNPNALWHRADIDKARVTKAPDLSRVVVAVDPSATSTGNEAGIVVVGQGGPLREWYVLDDRSLQASPDRWAQEAVAAYNRHKANLIVYETNQGGEMVRHVLLAKEPGVPLAAVHASRGKALRAEPVAALYEQGRVHHVGAFAELEDQMCEWEPGETSPDRLDALVWGVSYLSQSSSFAIG